MSKVTGWVASGGNSASDGNVHYGVFPQILKRFKYARLIAITILSDGLYIGNVWKKKKKKKKKQQHFLGIG